MAVISQSALVTVLISHLKSMEKIATYFRHGWWSRFWRRLLAALMIVLPLTGIVMDFLEDNSSDRWLPDLILDSSVLIAIMVGSLFPRGLGQKERQSSILALFLLMVLLGSCANVLANIELLGSGPDSFVGLVEWPIRCSIGAVWGMGIRRLILDSSTGNPPTSDHGQTPG